MPDRSRQTPQALVDIDAIYDYIADNSPEAADRVVRRLRDVMRMLGDNPLAGRSRPEFGSGVRSFPSGNYLIFYRSAANGVDIIRVLHGAREIGEGEFP